MKNIKLEYLSTRFKALMLTGALVLTTGVGIGCSSQKNNSSSKEETETVIESTTEVTDTSTEVPVTPEYYDEISRFEDDLTVLINEEILSNGVMEIKEEDKKDKVELITNAYITINDSNLTARALGSLDQNGELISSEITEDYMHFVEAMSNSIAISDNSTVIDCSSLFIKDSDQNIIDKNDYEYLQNYLDTVATYNQAVYDGDKSLSKEKFNQLTSIKDAILTDPNIKIDIKASTLYMVVDSMLLIPNLVTKEETKTQLLNSVEEACEDKIVTNDEIDNTMDTEASQGSYESRFLSSTNKLLDSVLSKSADFRNDANQEYSYSSVITYVMNNIDLSKYNEPKTMFIEQENERQKQTSDKASKKETGKKYTKQVKPEEVPDKEKEDSEVTYEDEDGNIYPEDSITEEEIVAANNAGDAQAVSDYQKGFRNSNPTVAGKSAEWNSFYAAGYNRTYNGLLQQEKQIDEQNGITSSNNIDALTNLKQQLLAAYTTSYEEETTKTL